MDNVSRQEINYFWIGRADFLEYRHENDRRHASRAVPRPAGLALGGWRGRVMAGTLSDNSRICWLYQEKIQYTGAFGLATVTAPKWARRHI
jgi:hypothetical protein